MKKVIKIIIAMLVIVALLFGSVAGLKLIRKKNAKKVMVYSVNDVMVSPDIFFEDSMSYGEISADKVQSVFVSESQKVKEILVQEGQEVHKGDVLMTYDSTLTALQLERAENDLHQEEYNLQKAEEDLEILNKLVPVSEESDTYNDDYDYGYDDYSGFDDDFMDDTDSLDDIEPIDDMTEDEQDKEKDEEDNEDGEDDKDYEPQETGVLLYGSGTADDPYVYLWDPEDTLSDERMLAMFAPNISPANPDYDHYDFYEHQSDDIDTGDDISDSESYDDTETSIEHDTDQIIEREQNAQGGDEFIETLNTEESQTKTTDEFITDVEIKDTDTEEINRAMGSLEVEFVDSDDENSDDVDTDELDEPLFEEQIPKTDQNEQNNDSHPDKNNDDEIIDNQPTQDTSDEDNDLSDNTNETNDPTVIDNSDIYAAIENVEFSEEVDPNANSNQSNTNNTQNTVTPQNNTMAIPEYLNDAPTDLYVILEIHKDNNTDAPLLQSFGLHLIRDGVKVTIQLFNPNEENDEDNEEDDEKGEEGDEADSENEDAESDSEETDQFGEDDEADDFDGYDDYDDDGGFYDDSYDDSEENEEDEYANARVNPNGKYTAEEIAELRKEIEKDIRDLTISVKKANIALMEQQNEYASNVVKSKIDGVVKTVREPTEDMSDAVMVIQGGGGYTVTVNIGELEMMNVEQGQEVKVSSVSNEDETYSGYVQEIGNYPTSNEDSFGSGNPFVSYYPCKILIDENAEFREGDYLGVSFDTGKEKKGLYIESMFVRSDSKGKYVYVRGGNDKLERRNIRTGKSPDQYTVEVRGGLSRKDYIAFPYGTNVFEGAETEEATIDELYS